MSSGKKVFVGNLNYETSEEDLKSAFSTAGNVVEAKVVRRGSRSNGYGFVEFETEEIATKAVELLDKFLLNDRSINVQLSTSTGTKVGTGTGGNYQGGGGNYGGNYGGGNYNGPRRYRPPYRSYNPYYQRPYRGGGDRGGGRRVYFLRNNYNENGNNRRRNNDYGGRPPRRGYSNKFQGQRNPPSNTEKIESKTTIFVANLPFSVDDEQLIELFTKCGPIRTAHVVRNKGKSKGFGFVEFENQEGQQKALKEMDNHPVPYKNGEQKALSVKVAMAEIEKTEKETTTTTTEKSQD